ncbi:MAG: hypothetical protein IT384_23210 [Deltaproteobacteria bacterium]|nr:hypothetical protein [Deltaproteobacteria bacterium]
MMDVRIRDRYVQKGKLTRADVEKHLKELPDVTSNAELIDYETVLAEERAAAEAEGKSSPVESV